MPAASPDIERDDVVEVEEAWLAHPGRGRALDFVSAAATMPDPSVNAQEAAGWLLTEGAPSRLARIAAERVLNPAPSSPSPPVTETESEEKEQARDAIRRARRLSTADPRNAIAWVERSRQHASLGQSNAALLSMRRALALQPEHRYFLRAAARLHVHVDKPDVAHSLLRRSPRTRSDPWLVAAEIAISELAGRSPVYLREGRRLLEDGDWSPAHLTELAGAIATLELRNGRPKHARRLFSASLQAPNDNALAQAEWAADDLGSVREELMEVEPKVPHSYEALSMAAVGSGDRIQGLSQAWLWLLDQPFSTQPASFGSYHAGAIRDFERSLVFARRGLLANPGNPMLRNNAAFALAQLGRLSEAAEQLAAVRAVDLDANSRAVISATRGLLAFRRGEVQEAERCYGDAIAGAEDPTVRALARVMLVSELLRLRLPRAQESVESARAQAERALAPADHVWLDFLGGGR